MAATIRAVAGQRIPERRAGRDAELSAMVTEPHRQSRRDAPGDVDLPQVLDLRLEGYAREEIAEKMGCAVSTVNRKLDMIRQTWLENES